MRFLTPNQQHQSTEVIQHFYQKLSKSAIALNISLVFWDSKANGVH